MTQASLLSRRMIRGFAAVIALVLAAEGATLALLPVLGPAGAWIGAGLTLAALVSGAILVFGPMLRAVTRSTAELEAMQRKLAHSALHDHLTGLPNRRYVEEHLRRTLAAAARSGHVVGVLQIDLDSFKLINDRHGHAVGDRTLARVAARMQSAIRQSDFLGRTGGDEFVVIALEARNPRGIGTLAERLIERIGGALDSENIDGCEGRSAEGLGGRSAEGAGGRIGASIGIALSPPLAGDSSALLTQADAALYAVKAQGRGGYSFHPDAETFLDIHYPAPVDLRIAGGGRG